MGCTNFSFYRTRRGTVDDDESAGWPAHDTLSAALAEQPRIAIVSNPTAQHIEVALAAASAGCDLLIEKPISHSLDGCQQLKQVVDARKLVAMVGCQFRFHPLLIELRSELNAGRIGNVIGASAEWGEYLPGWHPWEDYRRSYSSRADMGGGVILTLIHPLDYLYWMFGDVARVQAATRSVPSLETPAAEDWAETTLTFASGVVAQVHLDYFQRPPVHQLKIWGDDGAAAIDFQAGVLEWRSATGDKAIVSRVPVGFERNSMFLDEARHFLDCVENRCPPAIPIDDGIEVLKIALSAKESAAAAACHA